LTKSLVKTHLPSECKERIPGSINEAEEKQKGVYTG